MEQQRTSGNNNGGVKPPTPRCPVRLRVYDISNGKAAMWSQIVLRHKIDGIWHTGIHVFGLEYFYGCGIDRMPPHQVESTYNMDIVETQLLGYTTKSRAEFERYLTRLQNKFTPETYDLIKWNCNHFSDTCARFLLNNKGIPDRILNLPNTVGSTFLGGIALHVFKRLAQGRNPVGGFSPEDPEHPRHEFFPQDEDKCCVISKAVRRKRPQNLVSILQGLNCGGSTDDCEVFSMASDTEYSSSSSSSLSCQSLSSNNSNNRLRRCRSRSQNNNNNGDGGKDEGTPVSDIRRSRSVSCQKRLSNTKSINRNCCQINHHCLPHPKVASTAPTGSSVPSSSSPIISLGLQSQFALDSDNEQCNIALAFSKSTKIYKHEKESLCCFKETTQKHYQKISPRSNILNNNNHLLPGEVVPIVLSVNRYSDSFCSHFTNQTLHSKKKANHKKSGSTISTGISSLVNSKTPPHQKNMQKQQHNSISESHPKKMSLQQHKNQIPSSTTTLPWGGGPGDSLTTTQQQHQCYDKKIHSKSGAMQNPLHEWLCHNIPVGRNSFHNDINNPSITEHRNSSGSTCVPSSILSVSTKSNTTTSTTTTTTTTTTNTSTPQFFPSSSCRSSELSTTCFNESLPPIQHHNKNNFDNFSYTTIPDDEYSSFYKTKNENISPKTCSTNHDSNHHNNNNPTTHEGFCISTKYNNPSSSLTPRSPICHYSPTYVDQDVNLYNKKNTIPLRDSQKQISSYENHRNGKNDCCSNKDDQDDLSRIGKGSGKMSCNFSKEWKKDPTLVASDTPLYGRLPMESTEGILHRSSSVSSMKASLYNTTVGNSSFQEEYYRTNNNFENENTFQYPQRSGDLIKPGALLCRKTSNLSTKAFELRNTTKLNTGYIKNETNFAGLGSNTQFPTTPLYSASSTTEEEPVYHESKAYYESSHNMTSSLSFRSQNEDEIKQQPTNKATGLSFADGLIRGFLSTSNPAKNSRSKMVSCPECGSTTVKDEFMCFHCGLDFMLIPEDN